MIQDLTKDKDKIAKRLEDLGLDTDNAAIVDSKYTIKPEMMKVCYLVVLFLNLLTFFLSSHQIMSKMASGFVTHVKNERVAECLNHMDVDGDGRVSYLEFMVKWKLLGKSKTCSDLQKK